MVQHPIGRRLVSSLAAMAALVLMFFPGNAAVAANAAPSGWQARIVGSEASPSRLIAVDKKQQLLFLFERHSPLRLAGKYACTTGQNDGDKFARGDLKTPEGVYFVIRRIGSGLDFEKYGDEAYTLNYPNPVDKLRRKTGYGIWIHGRGSPITPNLTEGCVSLNNTDIALLGKNLTPGTPVALAAAVQFAPTPTPEDTSLISALYKRTNEWAKAWASRSGKFFDYYDADAYSIAQGESFSDFRRQKERIFKAVSFIDITVRNVQALQGPGYWVTWFQQDHRASNLSTKGVRRLYWQKNKKGELRIVGMEWAPHLSGTLLAGLNGAPVFTDTTAGKKSAAIVASVAAAKPVPAAIPPQPAAPLKPTDAPVAVALAAMAKSAPQAAKPERKPADVSGFIESWRKAWEKGDLGAYAACYAADAAQGERVGAAAIRNHKAGLWRKSKPRQVVLTNIRITSKQDTIVAQMQQAYTDSRSFADMGIKTLYLQEKNNSWRIVREDWSPMQQ